VLLLARRWRQVGFSLHSSLQDQQPTTNLTRETRHDSERGWLVPAANN
jgi:hypothetical protein